MHGRRHKLWRSRAAGETLSRRTIIGRAAAISGTVLAAGSVLSQALAVPARAAVRRATVAAGTAVEQGATAPAVVMLADSDTIAVDASLGNDFRLTLGANRSMGNPANPADGQRIIFQITQGSAGDATVNWGSAYEFTSQLPQPVLSTSAGQTDVLGFVYSAPKGKWLLAAFVNGFS